MKEYFESIQTATIIFYRFIFFLFDGCTYFLLVVLMINHLKPNHMIITDELYVYQNLIFFKEKEKKYYTLIPFFLQILALLFYFEILELNFLGLNRNTVKNIQLREGEENNNENEERSSANSLVELIGQYTLGQRDLEKYLSNETDEKN